MRLIEAGPGPVMLAALRVADGLLWAGRQLHARYAVQPAPALAPDYVWAEQWRLGVLQFCWLGDSLRFSQRRMLTAGLCTRQAWEAYTGLLVCAGVLVKVSRAGCYWADTWNRHRLGVLLRRRAIALPYPINKPAPPLFHTRAAATQKAQRSAAAQLSVVWSKDVPGDAGR